MARMMNTGIDELVRKLNSLGQLTGDVAKSMILHGAKEVQEAWRESATRHEHVLTGEMVASIGYPSQPTDVGGVLAIEIYPQGKDSTGTRNAEKAFILHYGSSRIKGDHWVDEAEQKASDTANEAMENVLAQFLETGHVPAPPLGGTPAGAGSGIRKTKTK